MRKYISVFALAARSSIYKIMLIFALMSAAELGLFYAAVQKSQGGAVYGIEETVSLSGAAVACTVGFILVCIALSLTGCGFGSKVEYTLERLSVGEKTVTLLFSVYNTICFFVFWALQTALALVMCRIYINNLSGEYTGHQLTLLAFYRSEFFHGFLPLREVSGYVCNILLMLSMGLGTACFSYKRRRDKMDIALGIVTVIIAIWFSRPMGSLSANWMLSTVAVIYICVSLYMLFGGEREDEKIY